MEGFLRIIMNVIISVNFNVLMILFRKDGPTSILKFGGVSRTTPDKLYIYRDKI